MTKKSLYNWNQSGDITDTQKDAIGKFVSDSPSSTFEYEVSDLKKLYHWDGILERNKGQINIPNTIQAMRFFSAWWNNNLIVVVNGDGDYSVWLLVYEMPSRQMEAIIEKFGVTGLSSYRYDLDKAENRAREIEGMLKGDNPILYNDPTNLTVSYEDNYYSSNFPSYYDDGEVKRIEVPFYLAKIDPDAYFKPLDIVKIFREYNSSTGTAPYIVHGCVYLGNRKIAHVLSNNVVEINNWDKFISTLNNADKMLRYHPVIAFKRPEKIIEHIAKIIEGKDKYWSEKLDYNMLDVKNEDREVVKRANNCEHFVNRTVVGLNFSELTDRRVKKWSGSVFKAGSSSVREQLSQNETQLGSLTSYTPYSKISEINGYKNQAIANSGQSQVDREGYQMQTTIVTKPPSWYKLGW